MVTEEHPPERRTHLVVTVARHPLGTPRRTHLTHTRMVVKHQLGTPLHGHLIRIRMVIKPLRGMPPHELPIHTSTMIPRPGVTMAAEHPVRAGAEDGGVDRITIMHGEMEMHHLHGRPTRVTPHTPHG